MARIAGINIPQNKVVSVALTYIHGIGLTSAKQIIENADIDSDTRVYDLTTEQTVALRQTLEEIDLKLREMDPQDPVKYDFALFGLSVYENF